MQTTKIPVTLCDEMDRKIRRFVWGSSSEAHKVHLLSWDKICRPKDKGGLGFRSLRQQNIVYLMKLAWGVLTKGDELWVQVFRSKYGKGSWDINSIKTRGSLSYQWRAILSVWENTKQGLQWQLNDGNTTLFWHDSWLKPNFAMSDFIPDIDLCDTRNFTVQQFVTSAGEWLWELLSQLSLDVKQQLMARAPNLSQDKPDRIVWSFSPNGIFTIASAYASYCPSVDHTQFPWKKIWEWKGPQRMRTFLWLCAHEALLTNEKRSRIGIGDSALCPRCFTEEESSIHVIRDCFFVKSIWQSIVPVNHWQDFFAADMKDWLTLGLSNQLGGDGCASWDIIFGLLPWLAWRWRNSLVFGVEETTPEPPLATLQRYICDITMAKSSKEAVRSTTLGTT